MGSIKESVLDFNVVGAMLNKTSKPKPAIRSFNGE